MNPLVGFLSYVVFLLSIFIFFVFLAIRFVKAHERGASALEEIARKMDGGGRRLGS